MNSDQSDSTGYSHAQTVDAGQLEYAKEQQDIAVAAVVLQSGLLSERQLSQALATWTIHGSVPLAKHLGQLGLLDEAAQQRVSQQAAQRLASYSRSGDGNGATSKSVLLGTLDAIDPTGAVARLLGLRAAAGASAVDATGVRQAPVQYRLVRKLGQGGLGRVWLAFDEGLKRHVAVKEITARGNAAAMERFRREAEITGRLEHPSIVPIYQLGDETNSGETFYAMRFLGKRTLHDEIVEYHERRNEGEDNPLLIRRLLTDFVSVCQAIGHAHSRKVIHRDLKPENVAIDSFGQVIVIDWGLAKVIDDVNAIDTLADAAATLGGDQSTQQGQVLGTPLYMAPEQASGRIDELDERTDIYGLGAILFAILTGCAPHERTRETSSASGTRELLTAIAGESTPHARDVDPKADAALSAICAKAMARRRYARYQTASELADDVQRWMAGEPVTAYRQRPSQRLARWIQHHRIWSQIIAALLIIGVVALATLAITSRQNQLAERQVLFDEMRGFAREIDGQVAATAEEVAKDARFMSVLPPIQGIIDARSGAAASQGAAEGEGEEVWTGRLETIYEGLLRANPDYLAISYTALSPAPSSDTPSGGEPLDLVRVERNRNDAAYVRRVPASRLGKSADAELVQQTATLPPGDILLTVRRQDPVAGAARPMVRLFASTPVFDETTGDLFGVVSIEFNLLGRFVELLDNVEQRNARIYITDAEGKLLVSDDPKFGVEIQMENRMLPDTIPATAGFFSGGQPEQFDRSAGWLATRVALDPANSQTNIGVVLQLVEEP